MTAPQQPTYDSIYQIKITLKGSKPPIWRRVQLAGDTRLDELHQIIQIVMDWQGDHMHQFITETTHYGVTDLEFGLEMDDETKARLRDVAPKVKDKFLYEYDFGGNWVHEVLVEKIQPPEEGRRYPVCTGGRFAAPPEDCGGIRGYYNMINALSDPDHPEHEVYDNWLGGEEFDIEKIDIDKINRQLETLR